MALLPPITVFDIETTGLDPRKGHRIIEIAGVRIEGGQLTNKSFVSLVNPERAIPAEARQVNNISDHDVATSPTIENVLPKFLEFAADSVLMAHNAVFDMGFLQNEKEFCWGYVELPECFCTMRLAQSLYRSDFRSSLSQLCVKFGIPMNDARHRALEDATLAAQVLLKMLEQGQLQSLDDLRKRAAIGTLTSVRR